MRYLIILTVGLCLLIASVPATAERTQDEAAIRKVLEQTYVFANKHDAKAFSAQFGDDFEVWNGSTKGPVEYGKYMSDMWERHKNVQYKLLDEIGIIFVTPDVAIYKVQEEVTGELNADGRPQSPRRRLAARVLVKRNGNWLYAASFYRTIEE
jgi:ketosteroid isomerase-like protein